VRDLGAEATVDCTDDVAAQIRAVAPEGADAVMHLAGECPRRWPTSRRGTNGKYAVRID
jgi:hypothetical protein